MTDARRILGIDPGFGRMGFGCVDEVKSKIFFVDTGIISTPKDIPFAQRLLHIYSDLQELFEALLPDVVSIEKLHFAKNVTTGLRVAEARGLILLCAAQKNLPICEYAPSQIKKAITGDGKADKRAMQEMVRLLLQLQTIPKPDDAADALAIAITAATTPSE